ncbi:hypothetical protein [Granulicoccus sp. GXG6511]|uniref:hypothetical protein n=1 Tax=Granulicoccus sp. GXG6511 TaxID=3381351 RepID=UPI003D7D2863
MVQLADLNIGRKLGEGGQAQVFLLPDLPGQALKRYRADQLPALRVDVLRDLAAEATRLRIEGEPITHWATWPTETVSDGSQVVGFLMPLIPDEFFMSEGNLVGQPASFSYLAAPAAPMWGAVSLPGQEVRVRLLALLAGILQQLHHRRMVFGDLSWSNVQWTADPEPRVMLLDCDGIKPPAGEPVSKQLDSPDWEDPAALPGTPPDQDRDCYKLALMVCRVLTGDLNARPSADAGHAIPDLPPVITEALDRLLVQAAGPTGTRPTATEWRQALQGRAVQQVRVAPRPVPQPGFVWPHATGPSTVAVPGARRWRSVTAADDTAAVASAPTASGTGTPAGSITSTAHRTSRAGQESWLRRVLRKARAWAEGADEVPTEKALAEKALAEAALGETAGAAKGRASGSQQSTTPEVSGAADPPPSASAGSTGNRRWRPVEPPQD